MATPYTTKVSSDHYISNIEFRLEAYAKKEKYWVYPQKSDTFIKVYLSILDQIVLVLLYFPKE